MCKTWSQSEVTSQPVLSLHKEQKNCKISSWPLFSTQFMCGVPGGLGFSAFWKGQRVNLRNTSVQLHWVQGFFLSTSYPLAKHCVEADYKIFSRSRSLAPEKIKPLYWEKNSTIRRKWKRKLRSVCDVGTKFEHWCMRTATMVSVAIWGRRLPREGSLSLEIMPWIWLSWKWGALQEDTAGEKAACSLGGWAFLFQ